MHLCKLQELKHILRMGGNAAVFGGRQRMSLGGATPPLPALSPGSSPDHAKVAAAAGGKASKSNSRPDLLEAAAGQHTQHQQQQQRQISGNRERPQQQQPGKAGKKLHLDEATTAAASMNGLTVDLESVLGLQGRSNGSQWRFSIVFSQMFDLSTVSTSISRLWVYGRQVYT